MIAEQSVQERPARALRILHVATPGRYSGAERVAVSLMRGQQRAGHNVRMILKANEQMEAALAEQGLDFAVSRINGKLNFLSPARIARAARRFRADLVHTHLSTAAMWGGVSGRLWKIPVVAHVQALCRRYCFTFDDHLVACSQAVKEFLLAQGVNADRITVVHNPLDFEQLEDVPTATEARAELGLPRQAVVCGVLAHLSSKKGHRFLLEAAARLATRRPELHLVFVGEGPEESALRTATARAGLADRVIFAGYRQKGFRLIPAFDLVALPSVAVEGFPVCLAEASFLGKPTLGSRLSGIPEAIAEGRTGLLAEPGDVADLARQLDRLVRDRELRARLGAAGAWWARSKLGLDRSVAALDVVYLRCIHRCAAVAVH